VAETIGVAKQIEETCPRDLGADGHGETTKEEAADEGGGPEFQAGCKLQDFNLVSGGELLCQTLGGRIPG
jgi:hypothetical protein